LPFAARDLPPRGKRRVAHRQHIRQIAGIGAGILRSADIAGDEMGQRIF
jgi:hypothetical protein